MTSLLRLSLWLYRFKSSLAYPFERSKATLRYRLRHRRHRTGALHPHRIPEHIPLGAEVVGGAIDRLQERQQIRPLRRSQLRLNRGRRRKLLPIWPQPVQRENIRQGLGLAAMQVRRMVVDTEQRRHVEAIHPKRRAGGVVVADLYGVSNIERPHF